MMLYQFRRWENIRLVYYRFPSLWFGEFVMVIRSYLHWCFAFFRCRSRWNFVDHSKRWPNKHYFDGWQNRWLLEPNKFVHRTNRREVMNVKAYTEWQHHKHTYRYCQVHCAKCLFNENALIFLVAGINSLVAYSDVAFFHRQQDMR